jgi:hypothetical protein
VRDLEDRPLPVSTSKEDPRGPIGYLAPYDDHVVVRAQSRIASYRVETRVAKETTHVCLGCIHLEFVKRLPRSQRFVWMIVRGQHRGIVVIATDKKDPFQELTLQGR